jgi:outer membrane murein-binding lipoprotein Lpp
MRTLHALTLALVATVALAGCASHEQKIADAATRAVYQNDVDALTANFTPDLRQQVTRAQLGALSDLMHQEGDYRSLTETGTEPDGAYDFRADFTKTSLIVKMKLDGQGRIAGYRVIPVSTQ